MRASLAQHDGERRADEERSEGGVEHVEAAGEGAERRQHDAGAVGDETAPADGADAALHLRTRMQMAGDFPVTGGARGFVRQVEPGDPGDRNNLAGEAPRSVLIVVADDPDEFGDPRDGCERARNLVRDSLLQIAPVFAKHKHMLGDEYSMLDVAITPLLWRLDYYGIQMPKQAAPLMKYAERLFSRPAFSEALTSAERGMRK